MVICLIRWDYIWEGEYLSKWASAITILSVITAAPWYFWKKSQDEKDERNRASRNLYGELKDALDEGLNDEKYPEDANTIETGEGEQNFAGKKQAHFSGNHRKRDGPNPERAFRD